MSIRRALIAGLVAKACVAASVPALGQTVDVVRFGLYVAVDDIDRSVNFYEKLFGKAPQVRTPALAGFDVAGGLFRMVNRNAYAPGTSAGGRVRPYIRVGDIEAAFSTVSAWAPKSIEAPGLVTEGPFRFFRFADPDGNVLEIFSFNPPS